MDIKKIFIIANLLILTSFFAVSASIEEIKIHVDNLRWNFCSNRLAKKILSLDPVKSVTLNKKRSFVIITFKPDNKFDPANIKELIEKDTACRIKDIKITATGNIVKECNNLYLDIEGNSQKILLTKIKEPKKRISFKKKPVKAIVRASERMWDKTAKKLKNIAPNNRFEEQLKMFNKYKTYVRLKGPIHQAKNGIFKLSSKYYSHVRDLDLDDFKSSFQQ